MNMTVLSEPKIYHIVHIDRLASIINDGFLRCDADMTKRSSKGTTIGIEGIKQRRLDELTLNSYPDLYVGDCVPFYFCPRSVMLYVIYRADKDELSYKGGQDPIIHLEADLRQTVKWAQKNDLRWAFTLSNAGSYYFEDRCNLADLQEIDWVAVQAPKWKNCKENKQAEFLIESRFPWTLVSRIGLRTQQVRVQANEILKDALHKPPVEILTKWYYY